MIRVTITAPSPELAGPWNDLLQRAEGNVFMSPEILCAAAEISVLHVLLAWDTQTHPHRLVGLWALREESQTDRISSWLRPAALRSTPWDNGYCSHPVIDRACVDEVMTAFFEALRRAPRLPKLIRLMWFDTTTPAYAAIRRLLAGSGRYWEYRRDERPFVNSPGDFKRSGKTGKRLRQQWRRLTQLPGGADFINEREPAAVRDAFEQWLQMEHAQWKGKQGSSQLSSQRMAQFSRTLIANLAKTRNVSVTSLRVDGRPIAMSVVFYCATTAYAWKTAYDAQFAQFSPGSVMLDKLVEQLLDEGEVTRIDSCSYGQSHMAQFMTGHHSILDDAVLDVHRVVSPALVRELAGRWLQQIIRRFQARIRPRAPRVTTAANLDTFSRHETLAAALPPIHHTEAQ